ncbi:MAG: hypothetical protein BMS9Abin34_398 [Patescibacteria group bacterium]|nr:MAG: hypothetical protein BMS9Abin34_398 [Patescibacteria group bacterium]
MEEKKKPNVCVECGYEGSEEDICPECSGSMVPAEEIGEVESEEAEE